MPLGSHLLGEKIILETVSENTPELIINNDLFFIGGDKLLGTFDKLEVVEFSTASLTMGASLGKLIPISHEQIEVLRQKFLVKGILIENLLAVECSFRYLYICQKCKQRVKLKYIVSSLLVDIFET